MSRSDRGVTIAPQVPQRLASPLGRGGGEAVGEGTMPHGDFPIHNAQSTIHNCGRGFLSCYFYVCFRGINAVEVGRCGCIPLSHNLRLRQLPFQGSEFFLPEREGGPRSGGRVQCVADPRFCILHSFKRRTRNAYPYNLVRHTGRTLRDSLLQ